LQCFFTIKQLAPAGVWAIRFGFCWVH
jgi:hypothetical protein